MLLKRSSIAFFLYLASVVTSSPTNVTLSAPENACAVQASNSTTDPIPHQTRRTIDEKAFILSNGAAVISAATALATFLTSVIKEQSDKHSCAVVSGTVNGVHYQYSASGRNCDTSSEEKTINAAMDRALKFMQDKRVDAACFQLTHGGTWKGLLQLAASGEPIIQNKCLSVSYPINV